MIPLPLPELALAVETAAAVPGAAVPHVALRCRASATAPVLGALLRAQVRIEPSRRRYDAGEAARLADLFGDRSRWHETLRSLFWAQATTLVPGFETSTALEVLVPCPLELALGPARILFALDPATSLPISLHWSGTILHARQGGGVLAAPVPWTAESRFELALATVREAAAAHGASGAVSVGAEVLERLRAVQRARSLPTLAGALEALVLGAPGKEAA